MAGDGVEAGIEGAGKEVESEDALAKKSEAARRRKLLIQKQLDETKRSTVDRLLGHRGNRKAAQDRREQRKVRGLTPPLQGVRPRRRARVDPCHLVGRKSLLSAYSPLLTNRNNGRLRTAEKATGG